ncbi:endonuclease SmrB [Glaciecola sp. XM2]|jgi:DNA-nicking Smr family endonuclease|uniref:endonuclease SmrB n=1 Tax=Glaciecola sp. XM2 TaxID=1914931 RepID=UPI001BDF5953|nr:endonuclease SmrB [Glaciecola sp. XM2]MBT1450908.1 endonuclease SmrB [Glaciecola sp. XM2]
MTKKVDENDESQSFSALFSDAKPIQHQQYIQDPKEKRALNRRPMAQQKKAVKQRAASFEFSDGFEAYFDPHKALKYVKENTEQAAQGVKRLRRGEIVPELILDLHGLNSAQSKLELAAAIDEATHKHYECINVIHGVSGGVLKQKVPNYLVQHPRVLGFHQAPLEWGGNGALLVLIDIPRDGKL